jgi:hypothetical protein
MTDDVTQRASAHLFYHVVRSILNDFDQVVIFNDVKSLDKLQLATFILKMLTKYKDRVKIPILTTFQDMLRREQPPQMFSPPNTETEIMLRTGEQQIPEVETNDMSKILKSDIRLVVTEKPVAGGFKKRHAKRS